MGHEYFILEDGEQKGPFTFDELTDLEIGIHDRILSPLADTWQDACDLPELYPYFEAQGVYFPTGDNLASFWWRLLAFMIDYLIISFVLGIVLTILIPNIVAVKIQSYDELLKFSRSLPEGDMIKLQLIFYVTLIIYDSVGEMSSIKGSLGKRICKLVVVDVDGTGLSFSKALIRSLGKIASLAFYGAGFLSIFFTEHRQALHDYLARTYVVKRD